MKKLSLMTLLLLAAMLFTPAESRAATKNTPRERIAVAEPRAVGGIPAEGLQGISEYIESKLGGNYEIFSRTALQAILKETAFTNSGMVIEESVRQQLAQKSVDCLLV